MIEKKEVPDAVLDEQDRLEDNARPLEALSRFAMEVVGQWKKWGGGSGVLSIRTTDYFTDLMSCTGS